MPARFPINGFLASMLIAVLIAALWPSLGATGGALHLESGTLIGVALVFFLNGAGLSVDKLRAGAANWRLHLFVQGFTFIVFPLIGLAVFTLCQRIINRDLLFGFFYLCALSSTVSSSIAMTSLARGNISAAIFNATLSILIGMIATPVLVGLVLHSSGHGAPLGQQLADIGLQLLLPFALGQVLRPWIEPILSRYRNITSKVDRIVIVMIVFNAFSDSSKAGVWTHYGIATLAATFALTGGLLVSVLTATAWSARRLHFDKPGEITAVFCGSKKSLATGIPMAKLLFGAAPNLGIIVLPIMIYHQLQLLLCSYIAKKYAARTTA